MASEEAAGRADHVAGLDLILVAATDQDCRTEPAPNMIPIESPIEIVIPVAGTVLAVTAAVSLVMRGTRAAVVTALNRNGRRRNR
jgi:hypothetical protein